MSSLNRLVDALRCLPGVGPKSAQRMVYYLLQHQRQRGLHLANCLEEAMKTVKHCSICNNFSDQTLCSLCQNINRDKTQICVVESPADVLAIENSVTYNGRYYVLMGKISPLDGLGPEDIGLPKLLSLIRTESIAEVILALTPSIEGQTTAHFIQELLHDQAVKMTQLAHGIPSAGELEYLDGQTIGFALRNRMALY